MKNFVIIYNRLKHIDKLIRLKCTGTAKEFSEKLEISERTLFYHFNILKALGYKMSYSYGEKTYLYI